MVHVIKSAHFDSLLSTFGKDLMYNGGHVSSLAMNYCVLRNNKFMYSNMVDVISPRQLLPGLLGLLQGLMLGYNCGHLAI